MNKPTSINKDYEAPKFEPLEYKGKVIMSDEPKEIKCSKPCPCHCHSVEFQECENGNCNHVMGCNCKHTPPSITSNPEVIPGIANTIRASGSSDWEERLAKKDYEWLVANLISMTYKIDRAEFLKKLLEQARLEGIEEGIDKLFQAIDNEMKSFTIDEAVGKIMQKLKKDLK